MTGVFIKKKKIWTLIYIDRKIPCEDRDRD